MNNNTAIEIDALRRAGYTPTMIAEKLGISVNTVKSHIRRHPMTDKPRCLFCGAVVRQNEGRKQKKFCSNKCRMGYWNRRYRSKEAADEN